MITVKYWLGTRQVEEQASTYSDAMQIAAKNQNAHGPSFWTAEGEQLHDDGNCLVTESELERSAREPDTAIRAYA